MRLFICLLLLLFSPPVFAGNVVTVGLDGSATSGSPPVSYLYDFEESGTPTGITVSIGTPDFDYTPAISGSESAALLGKTDSEDKEFYFAVSPDAPDGTVCIKYKVRFNLSDGNTSRKLAWFATNTSERAAFYYSHASGIANIGVKSIGDGTIYNTTIGISGSTNYYICLTNNNSDGSNNGTSTISISVNDECLTSGPGFAVSSAGTSTSDANRLYIGGDIYSSSTASYDMIIDEIAECE